MTPPLLDAGGSLPSRRVAVKLDRYPADTSSSNGGRRDDVPLPLVQGDRFLEDVRAVSPRRSSCSVSARSTRASACMLGQSVSKRESRRFAGKAFGVRVIRRASTLARVPRHIACVKRSSSEAASSLTSVRRSASSYRPWEKTARARNAAVVERYDCSPMRSSAWYPARSSRSAAVESPAMQLGPARIHPERRELDVEAELVEGQVASPVMLACAGEATAHGLQHRQHRVDDGLQGGLAAVLLANREAAADPFVDTAAAPPARPDTSCPGSTTSYAGDPRAGRSRAPARGLPPSSRTASETSARPQPAPMRVAVRVDRRSPRTPGSPALRPPAPAGPQLRDRGRGGGRTARSGPASEAARRPPTRQVSLPRLKTSSALTASPAPARRRRDRASPQPASPDAHRVGTPRAPEALTRPTRPRGRTHADPPQPDASRHAPRARPWCCRRDRVRCGSEWSAQGDGRRSPRVR